MPLTLVADPLSPNANAYCDLAFANAHHYSRLHNEDWDAITDNEIKNRAIAWATEILEALDWQGTKVSGGYPLRFPRDGVYDRDGVLLPNNVVPVDIKKGCAELALFMIREDRTEGLDAIQPDTLQIGSIGMRKIKYNKFPPAVMSYIGHYLTSQSNFQAKTQRV